jgi:serine/threonine protein kinase
MMCVLFLLLQKLSKDYIVRCHYYQEIRSGDLSYYGIVMERCKCNLAQYVMEQELRPLSNNRPLLKSFTLQLLLAYDAIHKENICHRDVKPENVLVIERDGTPPKLKLCDFEHSKVFDIEGRTLMHTQVGTCNQHGCWWAPDLFHPAAQLTVADDETTENGGYRRAADIWPLGCILHFMATDGKHKLFCAQKLDHVDVWVNASKGLVAEAHDDRDKRIAAIQKSDIHTTNFIMYDLIEKLVRPAAPPDATLIDRESLFRWRLTDVIAHPALWSSAAICRIITEFSNLILENTPKTYQLRIALKTAQGFSNWPSELEKRSHKANRELKIIFENTVKLKCPNLMKTPGNMVLLMKALRNIIQHCSTVVSESAMDDLSRTFADQVVAVFPTLMPMLFEKTSRFGTWTLDNGMPNFEWNQN